MTEWAEINIKLLNNDRCSCIISKALKILKGLVSFYADIIGMPSWPSTENVQKNKHTSLLLLKLYLSNSYLQRKEISEYLDSTPEKLLIIATKNLMNLNSDKEANNLLNTLNVSDFDTDNDLQKAFVSETLRNFDQILRICLLDIWRFNEGKTRQATAALNLKLAKRSSETKDITASTALAIDKAAENVAKAQLTNLKTNLRLSNLIKAVRRQDDRSGEIINQMKSTVKKTQKNYTGTALKGRQLPCHTHRL
jgi:methyl-accepting chemotaxis protein